MRELFKDWYVRGLLIVWSLCFLSFCFSGPIGGAIFGTILPFQLFSLFLMLVSIALVVVSPILEFILKSPKPMYCAFINLAGIVFIGFSLLFFLPEHKLTNLLRGKPVLIARYKGTQNSAILTFRRNEKFDIFAHSWPGIGDYYKGIYRKEGDNILLIPSSPWPERYPNSAQIVGNVVHFSGTNLRWEIIYNNEWIK